MQAKAVSLLLLRALCTLLLFPSGASAAKRRKGQYIFSNDEHRGFDVFKITAKGHRH
jgi:hypothetical protein